MTDKNKEPPKIETTNEKPLDYKNTNEKPPSYDNIKKILFKKNIPNSAKTSKFLRIDNSNKS